MTGKTDNPDLELIAALNESLTSLLKGEKTIPVVLPENYPDNEIKKLALIFNQATSILDAYTDSLFSLSKGELDHEIPKGRMRIHDALKSLQANLHHLTWTTQRIAKGDFNQSVDFMGEFSQAFNSMTQQLKQAFETIETQNIKLHKKDKEMTRDLKLAAVIQKSLISDKIDIPGISIHTIYKPMILVGGDIFSFVEFRGENQFGVFIADVNGHGVNAALITGILKVLINTAGDIRRKPDELLYYINNRIVDLALNIYFTAFYGICDPEKRTFTFSRGGHNKPYMIRKNNDIYELDSDGPMLGVIKEIEIESGTIDLISGDKIIIYTDGLSEAENSEGEPFEVKALTSAFRKNIDLNIKDFVNAIYKNLTEYRGSEKFDDDVCILGIEIL